MQRLVQTSRGFVELTFRRHPGGRFAKRIGLVGGYGFLITHFGSDGWSEVGPTGWLSEAPTGGMSLGEFLAQVTGVPLDEAQHVSEESVAEWKRRRAAESH